MVFNIFIILILEIQVCIVVFFRWWSESWCRTGLTASLSSRSGSPVTDVGAFIHSLVRTVTFRNSLCVVFVSCSQNTTLWLTTLGVSVWCSTMKTSQEQTWEGEEELRWTQVQFLPSESHDLIYVWMTDHLFYGCAVHWCTFNGFFTPT